MYESLLSALEGVCDLDSLFSPSTLETATNQNIAAKNTAANATYKPLMSPYMAPTIRKTDMATQTGMPRAIASLPLSSGI